MKTKVQGKKIEKKDTDSWETSFKLSAHDYIDQLFFRSKEIVELERAKELRSQTVIFKE